MFGENNQLMNSKFARISARLDWEKIVDFCYWLISGPAHFLFISLYIPECDQLLIFLLSECAPLLQKRKAQNTYSTGTLN